MKFFCGLAFKLHHKENNFLPAILSLFCSLVGPNKFKSYIVNHNNASHTRLVRCVSKHLAPGLGFIREWKAHKKYCEEDHTVLLSLEYTILQTDVFEKRRNLEPMLLGSVTDP